MESIAELNVYLPWVVPVEATESLAVVEIHTTVGHIQSVQRRGESLAKILAYGEIKGCVLRQVVSGIGLSRKGVAEAGTVIQVRGSKRSPRKSDIAAKIERISLIVIEREEIGRGREIYAEVRYRFHY